MLAAVMCYAAHVRVLVCVQTIGAYFGTKTVKLGDRTRNLAIWVSRAHITLSASHAHMVADTVGSSSACRMSHVAYHRHIHVRVAHPYMCCGV